MAWLLVPLGFLLPYLARLPGAVTRGADWFWAYLPGVKGFLFFGMFNLIAVIPLAIAVALDQLWNAPIALAITAIVHAAASAFIHGEYDLASDAQAAIGLVVLPVVIGAVTAVAAAVAFAAELLLAA